MHNTNKINIRFLSYLESKEPKHQTVMQSQQYSLGYIHRPLDYLSLILYRNSFKKSDIWATFDQYFLYPAILKGTDRKDWVNTITLYINIFYTIFKNSLSINKAVNIGGLSISGKQAFQINKKKNKKTTTTTTTTKVEG